MTRAVDVLRIAASQLGVAEDPKGVRANNTPYNIWFGATGERAAWCAMFVSWCLYHAGLPAQAQNAKGFSWCDSGYEYFRNQGHTWPGTDRLLPGDLVFYETDLTKPGRDHIGMVEVVHDDGRVTTIEGNWGDEVARRTFSLPNEISGYARPAYTSEAGPPPPPMDDGPGYYPVLRRGMTENAVADLHLKLELVLNARLSASDSFDGDTETAVLTFQRDHGLQLFEGLVEPQTWLALNAKFRERGGSSAARPVRQREDPMSVLMHQPGADPGKEWWLRDPSGLMIDVTGSVRELAKAYPRSGDVMPAVWNRFVVANVAARKADENLADDAGPKRV